MSEIAACTLIQEEPDRKTERYMMMFKDYPDVVSVDTSLPISQATMPIKNTARGPPEPPSALQAAPTAAREYSTRGGAISA